MINEITKDDLNMSRARSAVIRATTQLDRLQQRIAQIHDADAKFIRTSVVDTPTLYAAKIELERLLALTQTARGMLDSADKGTMADIVLICKKLDLDV